MAELGPPDLATQKKIIEEYLSQSLKKGESWYLIDVRWFKQWKKYVGYDHWESFCVGDQSVHPGPIDNCSLFKPDTNILREHLVDDLDYVLLPSEAYEKLASWYGVAPGQEPIVRKVIEQGMFVKHCKVEVYLMDLKLCQNSDTTAVITHAFSRADTIATIEQEMRRIFSIPEDAEVRLWNRYMSNTYELLSKKDVTLQDAGLYQGQVIVVEVKNADGTWPRQAKSTSTYSSNYSSTSQRSSGYSGASGSSSTNESGSQSTNTNVYSSNSVNNYYNTYSDRSGTSKPGLCGLANLGNTCFMNSALQCMLNVSRLTDYMLSGKWEKELNKENPLGMKGEVAITYAELVRDVWSGQRSYTVPRNFKVAVGRFAPQFSGYQQQDSQELMAFLLDGLHEDLNRIRKKPYIELKDSGGRPDKIVAKEAWDNYKKRNDSVIVDIFHGLLKSTVRCPDCEKISVTFDPFCNLSLPLPVKKERQMEVIWVPLPPEKKPMQLKLTVPKTGSIRDLCLALESLVNVSSDKMVVTDVYNHRFHKIFSMEEGVHHILDRDDIFIYEIPNNNSDDPNTMILPIYLRDKIYSVRQSDHNSVSSQPLFGHPMLLAVPRNSCTYDKLYHLLLQRMSRYVKIPEAGDDWQEPSEDGEISNEDDLSLENNSSSGACNDNLVGHGSEASNGSGHDASDLYMETVSGHSEGENSTNNKMHPEENVASCSSSIRPLRKGKRIFALRAANSFGRDETGTVLVDDGRPLTLTNRTYIAVDWSKSAKDKFFDDKAAEEFEEHESMKARQKKTVMQLDDCLKLFMKEEQLSDKDPWFCPDCKQHKQATKKFDLWSLPEVLIIHLKRFSYNRYCRDKIDVLVEFPTHGLDLRKYIINEDSTECDVYDLIAVTNHYGGLGGGHYTAFAMNKDDGNWYYFDDSSVTSSSEESVVTKAAYVLVYQRKTINQNRKCPRSSKEQHTSSSLSINSNHTVSKFTDPSVPNGVGAASEEDDMETN
ncbi:ubiquitin carboxyl-terminal hydrolase 15-like [Biomphalaria glabrata]|uniref:Ubiquitin carboxyl-terminal hydrolase n=1 Tax=Biomphalaria glabrata TaxID=6526 RepID=A0A9W3A2F0_BIOGL|nr:ubiquitin carboxyl-terminal hydrolase 15-like [Biomphalaria glabrata]